MSKFLNSTVHKNRYFYVYRGLLRRLWTDSWLFFFFFHDTVDQNEAMTE